jgi:Protein of unknwon function (DUF3310)
MSKANEFSPTHYAGDYQHWDLVAKIPMNYFEGCTTKYVARWRRKNGLEDLKKALHYLDKLVEVTNYNEQRKLSKKEIKTEVTNFALMNNLGYSEEDYILMICTYNNLYDLITAHFILEEIIEEASLPKVKEEPNRPGTPEDGGHHAL